MQIAVKKIESLERDSFVLKTKIDELSKEHILLLEQKPPMIESSFGKLEETAEALNRFERHLSLQKSSINKSLEFCKFADGILGLFSFRCM